MMTNSPVATEIVSNGAVRSPDAAWIKITRWQAIAVELRKKFAPICPEFVIELHSDSDSLQILQ